MKVCAVPSILHTVGVSWNSRSEIDTAYTGKCDVALNNKHVLRKCLKALDEVHKKHVKRRLVSRYFQYLIFLLMP